MYLPLEPTFWRLLQLPLALLNSDKPSSQSAVTNEWQSGHQYDIYDLGNISPYHDAPAVPGVSVDLPDDCTVDQVILLHRHGSRGPVVEQKYVLELIATLDNARDVIGAAHLPPSLEFLKEGYEYQLVPQELTVVGRKELFNHGAQFALRYPTLSTDVVVAATIPRVIDSAHFFAQGVFGRKADNVTFLTTSDFHDPVSWLLPWKSCPKLSSVESNEAAHRWAEKYVPPITERLNALVPGIGFSFNDTRGALYACAYDLAARGVSPWCDVFTQRELRSLEYELDLSLDGLTGHGPEDPGYLIGAFYVKKLIERLTNGTEPLYLDFAQDFSILFPLSTMGLNKDSIPLHPVHPPRHRKFRTSHQAPFGANMVWEKFTCQKSFEGPQVRLVLNGATFPLGFCERSEDDSTYGTCSLDEFVRANDYSVRVAYKDAVWNTTCG